MNNKILNDYERRHNIDLSQTIKFCLNNNVFDNLLQVYYDEKEDFTFPIVNHLNFEDMLHGELLITELISNDNLDSYLSSFDAMVDYQQDFFPISFAVMPYSSWLLVGINKQNNLQVWITAPGGGSDLKLLCNNLFLFLNNCNQTINPEIKIENLYKRYEENFWRIG